MIAGLIQNSTLLIALTVVYGFLVRKKYTGSLSHKIIAGLLFGGLAIVGMNMPVHYTPGVIYDGRSIVMVLAGFFGGGITAAVSIAIAGTYRLFLGGAGIWAGTATIVTAASIGLLFRRIYKNKPELIKAPGIYGMGLLVHLVMLLCQLLLPWPSGLQVISQMWVPVLLVFPFATLLMGLLLKNEITRVSAEARIQKSEVLYRTTLRSIGDAVITTDKNGHIVFLNPVAEQLTGWQESEAIGKPIQAIFQIINEGSGCRVDCPVKKVLENGTIVGLANHTLLISKEGNKIPIADSGAPIKDENGNITGVVLVFRDQTEERSMQQQILKSEKGYKNLFENHAAIKLLIDPQTGDIADANRAAKLFYGYPRKQLKQMNIRDIAMSPIDELGKMAIVVTKSKNNLYPVEYRHRLSDGSVRHVEVFTSLIEFKEKEYYHSIVHDITEKKKNESLIQLLSKSTEQSPVSIIITDPKGNIEYVNPKFTEVSGYSREEVIGRNPSILNSATHDKEFYKDLWDTILSDKDWTGEFRNKKKNGELYWESAVISSIIDERGKITHFVATKEDVTEKKKNIAELQLAKEKAEESDQLKSTFLANMSHEIRTPLNAILGFSNILSTEVGLAPEERREFLSIINQSSDNLLQIINDILDISKLETGQLKIFLERIDVQAILDELYTIFKKRLAETGKENVNLILTKPDVLVFVNTDKIRFTQILINLLSNSLKFTSQGHIQFGISDINEKQVTFFVSDTGSGIKKEFLPSIFERFRQADDSSTRRHGGTGLGLSIVKNLVELMGGHITLESEEGKGTEVRFSLPVAASDGNQ